MKRLILTIALFLLTLTADAIFCKATLFVARRDPGEAPAGFSAVSLKAQDGTKLSAWFHPKPGGRCVMVLHGIGDNRRSSAGFAPRLLAAGYSVLLPDSRGHGLSGGDMVTYGLREKYDIVVWRQWLGEQGCTSAHGLGESLGAATLIQAAPLTDFRAIVAESAYSDLRSTARERVGRMVGLPPMLIGPPVVETARVYARLRYGIALGDVSPLKSIAESKTPILLVHGLDDDRTLPWHSQALAKANAASVLWLVPRVGHESAAGRAGAEWWRRVMAWFEDHR